MNPTLNILQGELERLFTMNELMDLCRSLLGIDPDDFGGASIGKAAFVRQLVSRCEREQATIALADAVQMTKSGMVDPRLKQVYSASYDEVLEAGAVVGRFEVVEHLGSYSLGNAYLAKELGTTVESAEEEGDAAGEGVQSSADDAPDDDGEKGDESPSEDAEASSEEEEAKLVRLEVVSAALTPDPRAVRRFLTTVRATKRFEHTKLLNVIECGVLEDGRPWTALKHVEGAKPLSELLEQGPKTLAEVWTIVRDVMEGLSALHSKGLAHADVKPENVLVVETKSGEGEDEKTEYQAYLIGLGSDRLFSRPTRDDREAGPLQGAGTPKCMAPEQARGKQTDRRTDLYGLGAMLYEIVTGRTVFTGRSGIDIVAKHLTEEPKPPSGMAPKGTVPQELDHIILKLLNKDALRRPSDVASIQKLLEEQVADQIAASMEPEGTIEDAQAAADAFLENPEDEELRELLDDAARAARAWEVAVEAYEMGLETTDDEELQGAIKHRLARIFAAETKEHERAEEIYRELLEANAEDEKAEQAIEELKRATGKYDELIEMLLSRVEKTEDVQVKVATLREVGKIYEEQTNQPEQAFTVLTAALQMQQDGALLDDLARLAGATGTWNDLVQACSNIVQNLQDPPAVVLITTRMGRWYGEQLGRQDYALPCYQQALAIDPANDEALKGMEEIFRRQQQWLELAQVLLSRAEAAQYPADKRDRLSEAADIFSTRLSDDGRAVELFTQILSDDPAHEASVNALEKIHVRTEDWDSLIKLYESKVTALTDPKKKAETLYFIAEVYEDHLSNDQAAIDEYKKVLEIDAAHVPTLKGLERQYAKTGEFRDLLSILEKQLEIAATPRQRVALYERRAQILEEEFVERKDALAEYGELLAIEPDNEQALTAVARLQKALERWEDLDGTYERHAAVTDDKEQRAVILRIRADHLLERLEDPATAAEVLSQLVTLQPENAEVLDDLAKTRLRAEDVEGAIESLTKLAAVTEEKERQAGVWVRIGELYERKLEDHEEAEAAFRKALDADKNNAVAAAALQERYAERGDMTAALAMLERQLESASGDLERSRIYIEMGKVCREKLDNQERAVEYYEKALELDTSNSSAAEPLAEIHRDAGRWDAAVAIYDRFSDATAAMPAEKKAEFYTSWGEASIRVDDLVKAEKAFRLAFDVDKENMTVAARLGDVLFKRESWEEAAKQYGFVVKEGAESLEPPRRAEVLTRRGISLEMGDALDDAGKSLDEALELIPTLELALRHRVDVHKAKKENEEAAQILSRLAEATEDTEGKIKVLIELGDLYSEELVEHEKAAQAYSSALNERPDDRNLLMRLMRAYSNTKQWSHLVEVVLKIADMETDVVKLARYYQTAAMIAHQELGRTEEAREYFETALENDPTLMKSFESLAEILTEKEEWEELADAYRNMLQRLPKDATDETKIKMYDALGGVLQSHLNKPEEAVEFLEKAQALDPDDRPRNETLARLYGDSADKASKSIPLHLRLLSLNPFRAESYRALRQIYSSTGQWDQQWCCARTLVNLRMADEEEEELYQHYKSDEIPAPGDCLTDEQWQNYLYQRGQDRNITSIFETIMPAVLQTQGRPLKAFDLDPASSKDLDTDEHPFCGLVKFAAATLGIEPPQVFFQEKSQESALIIQTNPPALLAGGIALSAAYQNPRALAFVVGRQLAYSRGGNLMRVYIESGTMMRAWLLAALKHVNPKIPIPSDLTGTVAACSGKITSGLGPVENETLRSQVTAFIESAAKVDLKQWATSVDFTADRAGFLICDDLEIASQLIRLEQGSPTPTKERLKELNLFSVSPDYFSLRQKLLIQVAE